MLRRYRVAPEGEAHVYGATMARNDMRPIVADLQQLTPSLVSAVDVLLDFTGVVSATSSYLKRTIFWLHDCARLAAEGSLPGPLDDPAVPLNIYIFVTGLSEEVRTELDEVMFQHNRTCLEIASDVDEHVTHARLLGPLDPALVKTLDALVRARQATATDLHQADVSPERQKITVNAWNNRLADLFGRRLVRRSKVGRHWVYEPVAREVQFHG